MSQKQDVKKLFAMIQSSPMLFPLNWDRQTDLITMLGLQESEYEQASFLDERILCEKSVTGTVPRALLQECPLHDSKPCNFVFHISHCGSTLLSRLLGLHPACFALREPKILRQLGSPEDSDARWIFKLLSRTFHPHQSALIKATSFTNEFAGEWLKTLPDSKAILMTLPLKPFFAAVLDGSSVDIQSQKIHRWNRLVDLGITINASPETLSPGQAAAMSWLCESLSLHAIHQRFPQRTMFLAFDELLTQPQEQLSRAADFLGFEPPYPVWIGHPIWGQYSKRPEVYYDSQMRTTLLTHAEQLFENDIQEGIEWLQSIPNLEVTGLHYER